MAQITGILCVILTRNVDGAGTDGSVYLGIGGREFRLDSSADDYERGSWREYVLGRGPVEPNLPPPQTRVQNKEKNDPRTLFALDTANLDRSPVYIRFEPEGSNDNWFVGYVAALVYIGSGDFVVAFTPATGYQNLWMGQSSGKIVYLTQEFRDSDQPVREMAQRLAAARE